MSKRNRSQNERDALERLSDRELIRRFAVSGEDEAFAMLLSRHAQMIFGVCRRILRHHQDAEDAFQATFLILATKAGKIRWQRSLANWLYTTASRVCLKVSAEAQKRRETPLSNEPIAARSALDEVARSAACRALDEELNRLPEKYRAPLVLCYLEGKTREQAAGELGLSAVVVKGRLQRGLCELRSRLVRRGIGLGLSAAGGGLVVSSGVRGCWVAPAAPRVPDKLLTATAKGAAQFATSGSGSGGITIQALQLAGGELMAASATSILKSATAAAVAAMLVGVPCLLLSSAVFAEKREQAVLALQLSAEVGGEDPPSMLAADLVAFQAGSSEGGSKTTGTEDSADEGDATDLATETGGEQKTAEPRTSPQADLQNPPMRVAESGTTYSAAAVHEAWNRRRSSIETLYAKGAFIENTKEPKAADPDDPFPGPQRADRELRDVQLRHEYVFALDRDKLSFAVDGEQWSQASKVRWFYKITFDGKDGAMLNDSDSVAMPLGKLWPESGPSELLTNNYHLTAWWLLLDPAEFLKKGGYNVDDMSVSPATTYRDGCECVEVLLPTVRPERIGLLYLDISREFVPVQFLALLDATVLSQFDMQHERHEECGWILASWALSQSDEANKPQRSISGSVTQCQVNAEVNDSVFTVEFPAGTHIMETTPAGRRYLVQLKSGELSPMRADQHGTPAGSRIGRKRP